MERIDSIDGLEAVTGPIPPAMHLKVIDHLDAGALGWLAESPLGFVGGGAGLTLAGGAPGFVRGDAHTLTLPVDRLDDAAMLRPGAPVATLFLLSGVGETLRVNGRVAGCDDAGVRIAVDECYGHCAKALIRSDFWKAAPVEVAADLDALVAATRLIALATQHGDAADISPKGDPAGCMVQRDGDRLWFADRPGNRRLDSFRNIARQPQVALTMLVPGATTVGHLRGRATLTADAAARARFAVQGKVPQLAVAVDIDALDIAASPALERAALWPLGTPSRIDAGKLFVDHIRANRTPGAQAAITRAALAVPGGVALVKQGLEQDYRENLY